MSVLNEFFDKIYCINLDSRTDKWEECENIFEKKGLIVERVSALQPQPSGLGHVKDAEKSLKETHKSIIERVKEDGLKNVLIFEDDVEFCDLLSDYSGESLDIRFENSINFLPEDWNVLYLGSGIDTDAKSHIGGELYKLGFAHTTHSISINCNFFDTVISQINQSDEPLDIIYSRLMGDNKIYSFSPNLISQRPSFSDIQRMNVNYGHLRNYYSLNK
jgi:GR25 family glycosyltransferase involved in LPS biosynthesis